MLTDALSIIVVVLVITGVAGWMEYRIQSERPINPCQ